MIQLLLIIRGYCCRFDDHQQSTWALENAKHRVSIFYQGADMWMSEYVEHFNALVGVVETYGGAYGREPSLVRAEIMTQTGIVDRDNPTPDELEIAYGKCPEQYLSCMLLRGSDY